jgi:hypothetical protein
MLTFNIILFGLLVASIGVTLYLGVLNFKRRKLNMQIAADLDLVLHSTLTMIKENKKNIANPNKEKITHYNDLYNPMDGNKLKDIKSSEMLSTMLTVIVNKYGDVRLSLKDFEKVSDQEYVSVYVDTTSKELILSSNHELISTDLTSMINFNNSDDSTFH